MTPSALAAFDPVDQTLVSRQREFTTVPTQALFMLNSSFVAKESLALAARLLAEKDESDSARIQRAYELIVGRTPDRQEISRVKKFIAQYESAYPKASPLELPAAEKPSLAMTENAGGTDGKAKPVVPENPDDIDTTDVAVVTEAVQPKTPQEAA